jgi:hypothetical protein
MQTPPSARSRTAISPAARGWSTRRAHAYCSRITASSIAGCNWAATPTATPTSRASLREAEEESGLHDLIVEPDIFDLDRHRIPARGDEPEHWHYDVRHVVRASGSEDFVVGEESHALAWRDIAAIANDESADESLRRMARKWLARGVKA